MEESVLDKAAIAKGEVMTAVQIKAEEVMTGEVLKIKAEYATVSAQLLEIDLHVEEMKAIEKSTKKVEGKIKRMQEAAKRKSKDGEISEKKIMELMTEWGDVKDQFGVLEKSCRK
jgi:hypothetical protein